jgi:hypothetical protein
MRGSTLISTGTCGAYRRREEDEMVQGNNMGATDGYHDTDIDGWYQPLNDLSNEKEYRDMIDPRNIKMASEKITQLLDGTHPEGKRILVPDSTIRQMIVSVFRSGTNYDVAKVIEEAIGNIVQYIQDDYRTTQRNSTYSIWNTVLGEENAHGLMPYAPIKTRENRPNQIFVGGRY